jgi:hypothetical protein
MVSVSAQPSDAVMRKWHGQLWCCGIFAAALAWALSHLWRPYVPVISRWEWGGFFAIMTALMIRKTYRIWRTTRGSDPN